MQLHKWIARIYDNSTSYSSRLQDHNTTPYAHTRLNKRIPVRPQLALGGRCFQAVSCSPQSGLRTSYTRINRTAVRPTPEAQQALLTVHLHTIAGAP
jgi:hypothetical protein